MVLRQQPNIPLELTTPFPISCSSSVIAGFGRGSAELGIPTANVPVNHDIDALSVGIYFGWCKLEPCFSEQPATVEKRNGEAVQFNYGMLLRAEDLNPLPMVMSIGFNPYYDNQDKAAELHIIHTFPDTFYGAKIRFVILGYIRPELDYTTKGMFRHFVCFPPSLLY